MTLDMAIVEDLLKQIYTSVTRDAEGDLEVAFTEHGYELTMWVMQSGRTGSVINCVVESPSHQVQRSRWPEAVWVCNQWNQSHFFPRVSLFVPDWRECVRAPVQCRTLLDLSYGEWDYQFLGFQLQGAGHHTGEFLQWIDRYPDLSDLFCKFDDTREHRHIWKLSEVGRMPGIGSFSEEFFIDEGSPRVREPADFFW